MSERDVGRVLTDAQIEALRRGFDGEAMARAALDSVAAAFPPGRSFVELTVERYFLSDHLPADQRELILIALLAAQHGGGLFLAIHLYWGLMEGLSPERLADALLLTGLYVGLPVFNGGAVLLRRVLSLLKGLVESENAADAVKSANVMTALQAAFR